MDKPSRPHIQPGDYANQLAAALRAPSELPLTFPPGDSSETLEVVDVANTLLGYEDRTAVHRRGAYHRGVVGIVTNPRGEILVQKRAANKSICPSHWDLSVAEHLQPGEVYPNAFARGLQEELHIAPSSPSQQLRNLHPHESVHKNGAFRENILLELYQVKLEGPYQVDSAEVAEAMFCSPVQIAELQKTEPFTPWFEEELVWLRQTGSHFLQGINTKKL